MIGIKKEWNAMKIIESYNVKNDCYVTNKNNPSGKYLEFQKNGPKGLMLHSVGCAQPSAKVFANAWNKSGYEVAVHAVLQDDGSVYQCLPWNYRGWHAGGTANNTHIGVEMTEPDCIKYTSGSTFTCSNLQKAKQQVAGTYETAVELFAYLCKKYGLDPLKDGVIISHAEGAKRGVASNHGDPSHLWNQLGTGYTMDGFRKDVKAKMSPATQTVYRVRKTWSDAASQIGAYTSLDNAKNACDKAGSAYRVFNESGKVIYPVSTTSTSTSFKVGDQVKLVAGAKYYNGQMIPDFVFDSKLYVRELQDNGNVVISTLKTGAITGVVNKKYLTKITSSSSSAFASYKVQVTVSALNIRAGAGTNYQIAGCIRDKGVYTIVGQSGNWGKLKSGKGWICLDYTKKV